MALLTAFLTISLFLSASAVNGLPTSIHQPLDAPNGRQQPYHITIVNTDRHHQPLITSELSPRPSRENPIRVCITVGNNPDGTKRQICAENPNDLCYDAVWQVMPRPANILPWCALEETSTELKAKRLVPRQGRSGSGEVMVERRGGKVPSPGPLVPREAKHCQAC